MQSFEGLREEKMVANCVYKIVKSTKCKALCSLFANGSSRVMNLQCRKIHTNITCNAIYSYLLLVILTVDTMSCDNLRYLALIGWTVNRYSRLGPITRTPGNSNLAPNLYQLSYQADCTGRWS